MDVKTFPHVLLTDVKSCSIRRDLLWGRRIHVKAVDCSDLYLLTGLIKMYATCSSMVEARCLFDSIHKPDKVSWTALVLGYADNGEGHVALQLFFRMKECGCVPDSVTYVAALKACTSLAVNADGNGKKSCLAQGREIHSTIGCHIDLYVQGTLIDMYAKCGSMPDAHLVFDSILNPNVVCWNALLLGYADNGEGNVALELFYRMKSQCALDFLTYGAALKACTSFAVNGDGSGKRACLERGTEVHLEIIAAHLNHYYLQSMLIEMYSKCGCMIDARHVFDSIHNPNVVCWNALILGYAENREGLTSLELFSRMKACGCVPTSVTYVAALKACIFLDGRFGNGDRLHWGMQIHFQIGRHMDGYVQGTLIDMYAKLGCMVDAHRVFEKIRNPNVVCWTTLISGYVDNGKGLSALDLFSRMKACGRVPNHVTYVAALKACALLDSGKEDCLEQGRNIHLEIDRPLDPYIQGTLIYMYSKCSSMLDARQVFDSMQKPDVVCWTALLLGYVENGEGLVVLDLFSRMKVHGCAPNSVTYVAVLKACDLVGALALGRKFHLEISEFTSHIVTCLVDFYAKCGSMVEARETFDIHPKARDVTTWNALLAGYGRLGDGDLVFKLFQAMQDEGFYPDAITLLCVLSCCSHAGLVDKAREYFAAITLRYGVTPIVMHYNCMVDVLGRANQLNEAIAVMRKMPCNPVAVTWKALLGACCKWKNVGMGRLAFRSLVDMDKQDASAYVLMAHLYGSKGMWEEQESVLETRMKLTCQMQVY